MADKRRRKKTILTTDGKRLFIVMRAVMHPLVALCDGLPLVFFGQDKTAYLDIDVAIRWAESEAERNPQWANRKQGGGPSGKTILKALYNVKRDFDAGNIEYNDGQGVR